MTENEVARTALVVMDVQRGIVDRIDDPAYLPRIGELIEGAREAGVTMVHVRVGFRRGHPEIAGRNRFFRSVKDAGRMVEGESSEFVPEASPKPGEIVVVKKRVSAFAGNDLELILRAGGIENLALAGVTTSGVVLSTVRAAADMDYRLAVVRDGCADPDGELHEMLMERVFPAQGEVATIEDWLAGLRS